MSYLLREDRTKRNHGRNRPRDAERTTTDSARFEIEKLVAEILKNYGRAVAVVGSHLEILNANKEFGDLLGYRADDLIGKTTMEITIPEDRGKTGFYEKSLWEGRLPMYEMEKCYVRADGTILRVYLRSFIISNDIGEPVCEMKVIQPLDRTTSLVDRLFDRVISTLDFPMSYGLPIQ